MFKYKCYKKKIDSLNILEYVGDPLAPTIIFFHGYGGSPSCFSGFPTRYQKNDNDIVPNWIFPEGPFTTSLSFNEQGRAWFPLSISAFQSALAANDPEKTLLAFPLDISKNVSVVKKMLEIFYSKKVILGGFSQGAVISTEIFLTSKLNYEGLVIMSGTLINKDSWNAAAANKRGSHFLQTHGRHDSILPWSLAKELEILLTTNGLKGHLTSFNGGHETPESLFTDIKNLMQTVVN